MSSDRQLVWHGSHSALEDPSACKLQAGCCGTALTWLRWPPAACSPRESRCPRGMASRSCEMHGQCVRQPSPLETPAGLASPRRAARTAAGAAATPPRGSGWRAALTWRRKRRARAQTCQSAPPRSACRAVRRRLLSPVCLAQQDRQVHSRPAGPNPRDLQLQHALRAGSPAHLRRRAAQEAPPATPPTMTTLAGVWVAIARTPSAVGLATTLDRWPSINLALLQPRCAKAGLGGAGNALRRMGESGAGGRVQRLGATGALVRP